MQRFHEILWSVPVACGALIGQAACWSLLDSPSRVPEGTRKKINWAFLFFEAAQGSHSDPSRPVLRLVRGGRRRLLERAGVCFGSRFFAILSTRVFGCICVVLFVYSAAQLFAYSLDSLLSSSVNHKEPRLHDVSDTFLLPASLHAPCLVHLLC